MSGRRSNSAAVDTVNAAASVIAAAADNRLSPSTAQVHKKRRWGGFLNLSGCVASRKHHSRIIDAVVVPDPIPPRVEAAPAAESLLQPSSIVIFPFVAPPSSPVSFLQSEPPSVTLSPVNGLSLNNAVSESMYSPGRPASMFDIGPYAHETQLVSPPVPSTYTTEPSTAPFTPPPESVYLTRPSSPEVPFGWLLSPIHQNGGNAQASSYQLPDAEIVPECHHFIDFITTDSSKLAGLKSTEPFEWRSSQGSSAMEHRNHSDFVLNHHRKSNASPRSHIHHLWRNDDEVGDHRFIF